MVNTNSGRRSTAGVSLVELLALIFIIALLLAMMLPALNQTCSPARQTQCTNNLRQLGIAIINYAACRPSNSLPSCTRGDTDRRSGLVAILPNLDESALHEQIALPLKTPQASFPAMGPTPWVKDYPPWSQRIDVLVCSSDRNIVDGAATSYVFCVGDVTRIYDKQQRPAGEFVPVQWRFGANHKPRKPRGAFSPGQSLSLDSFTDGTSNTILMGETNYGKLAINQPVIYLDRPFHCLKDSPRQVPSDHPRTRGYRWADGGAGPAMFSTILPPNSISCAVGGSDGVNGVYSVGSYHPGGAQVLMADGSVQFISEDIDTGDLSQPPIAPGASGESPYGVWGALGTTNAGDQSEPY
ncbi:DUF1559 domain-containing protein [bacterium]|nr:DUF1559 domain-containing protein [bacterium]